MLGPSIHTSSLCPLPKAFTPNLVPLQDVLPQVAAIAEEAPEDVLEAAEAKDDPIARFVLARILSQTAAHSHLQWDTLVEGERFFFVCVYVFICVFMRFRNV